MKAARWRLSTLWPPLVLLAAGILAYQNSLHGAFLFDDERNIVDNDKIRNLHAVWRHLPSNDRPLVLLSLAVNYRLGGLEPRGYHIFNLAVHLLAGLTLYGVIRRTLQLPLPLRESFIALAAALLWLLHPLQTQSVTYVIQRAESMMGLFYLLTLYCFIRGASLPLPLKERAGVRVTAWFAAAVLSCAAAIGCKGVAVTAPLVALAYDVCFLTRSPRETLRRRWAVYLGLFSIWLIPILNGHANRIFFARSGKSTVGFGYQGIEWWQYAAAQPGVILHYLSLSIYPANQCLDYDWQTPAGPWGVVLPAAAIALLIVLTVWALRRTPPLGYLGLWFFLILAPTSSVIPIKDLAFEHRMYLPLAGVVVLVVCLGEFLARTIAARFPGSGRRLAILKFAVIVIVATGLGYLTARRNDAYASPATMWRDVTRKAPSNARGFNNLAEALLNEKRFAGAADAARGALAIDPRFGDARVNLGNALMKLNRPSEALGEYKAVFQPGVKFRKAHNVAVAHNCLGVAYMDVHQFADAAEEFQRAIAVSPRYGKAFTNLGHALRELKHWPAAIDAYREAARLQSSSVAAQSDLGNALLVQGRYAEAIEAFNAVLALDPDHRSARRNLRACVKASQGSSGR